MFTLGTMFMLHHRYGRHLVIEYAEAERSVESMRGRLREQISATSNGESANADGGTQRKHGKI